MADKINFLSNDVNWFQFTNKKSKLTKYFSNRIVSNGFLFLQETHSTAKDEIKWKNNFKGQVNSCGFYLFHRLFKIAILGICTSDNNGRVLVLAVDIGEENFVLINLYNPNSKAAQ